MNPQLQAILHDITSRLAKLEQAEKQATLDKMAENAREIGLNYEPVAWRNAAIRLGEELSSVGPNGYYDMDATQWLHWALDQQPRGRNSLPNTKKHEPVAWWNGLGGLCSVFGVHRNTPGIGGKDVVPLYTAPQKREWVGLTDEDWDEIFGNALTVGEAIKSTEAKLKERNT